MSVLRGVGALFLLAFIWIDSAIAQSYPAKPITVVVPYPPGGTTDALARIVMAEVSSRVGQPIVIDNKAGAGGSIGRSQVAGAAADGYMLVLDSVTNVSEALTPVAGLGAVPYVLAVSKNVPVSSVGDLVKQSQSKSAIRFGTAGSGSISDLAVDELVRRSGAAVTKTDYRGSGPALTDLRAGSVDAVFLDVASAASLKGDERTRLLGIASRQRSPLLSEVPTLGAQGVAMTVTNGFVLYAPSATPIQSIDVLQRAIRSVLADTRVKERLLSLGIETGPSFEGSAGDPTCPSGKTYCKCKKKCIPTGEACPAC